MFKPLDALKNFLIIQVSLWPVFLSWIVLVFLLGLLLCLRDNGAHFVDSVYLAFSTALSLGTPSVDSFSSWWRIVELVLDMLGIMLWGIFTFVTAKAIENAYDE